LIAVEQLTIQDAIAELEAQAQGFDDWDVFEHAVSAPDGYTVAELAGRWRLSEVRALDFLEGFERHGFAVCRSGFWRATEEARRLQLVDRDGVPL
jgi:hypothetical protein